MSFNFLLQIQTVTESEETINGITDVSILSIFSNSNGGMGWFINILLVGMLGYAIYLIVNRYMALKKDHIEEDFSSTIKSFLHEGKVEEARLYCANSDNPSAKILEKAITRLGKPIETIVLNMESTAKTEMLRLNQKLDTLKLIAGLAPLIGILVMSFRFIYALINDQMVTVETESTFNFDVMTALITLSFGTFVGIVAYSGYYFLKMKINRIVNAIESSTLEFLEILD